MCGLVGFIGGTHVADGCDVMLRRMSDTLRHRGPDDGGYWYDADSRVGIGHRRLAIVDLSAAGHQPMTSASGRYVIAFNGEIYNHAQLRSEIGDCGADGTRWRGHSDTETLLAGIERWGIEQTLAKVVGMFAIALWDGQARQLTLARDRLGEKPLYYGFQNNTFLFGSELKALRAHPDFAGEIDRDVLCLYLRHCYIPAPYAIYRGIHKLWPGTYIQLRLGSRNELLPLTQPKAYWRLEDAVERGLREPFVGTEEEAIALLHDQLRQSVALQMVADVPLGAFLSGGVDSSTVVGLMQAQSPRPVKTFSIGFNEPGFDESSFAGAVAGHLGTDHTALRVTSADALDTIPSLGSTYDEPFADASQIPTFLVAQLARQQVTVSLSGDGGDELFCGYHSYALAHRWQRIARLPRALRKTAGGLLKATAPAHWHELTARIRGSLSTPGNLGQRLDNLANRLMRVDGTGELFYSLDSVIPDPENVVIGAREPATWLTEVGMKASVDDARLHMMLMSAMTYLPDDILTKVDRAAMANSLETRMPLLDHRVAELAFALPMSFKMRDGQGKWILRQVLYKYVPRELVERPKSGFSIPLGLWLRGVLRDWAAALLDPGRLRREGFFDAGYVGQQWRQHLAGEKDNAVFLWNILMFQVWLEQQAAEAH
ncbi:MAG: asparagine synthase (glutamine-hydrolyzing) [Halioglobus sp.]